MHREADMIEQQAKQGKQDHNQQGGENLSDFILRENLNYYIMKVLLLLLYYETTLGNSQNQSNPTTTATPGPNQQQQQSQTQQQQQQQQTSAAQNGGQADYSVQWAEYYRSIGKIKEAEAIEAQMKAGKVFPSKYNSRSFHVLYCYLLMF
jgi:hypothetical protein